MRKNGTYSTITQWSSTVGHLIAVKARVRAICDRCAYDRPIDLHRIEAHLGGAFSLWNQRPPCPSSGCPGRAWFQAALPAPGWPTNMKDGTPHHAEGLRHAWLEGYDFFEWERQGGTRFDF